MRAMRSRSFSVRCTTLRTGGGAGCSIAPSGPRELSVTHTLANQYFRWLERGQWLEFGTGSPWRHRGIGTWVELNVQRLAQHFPGWLRLPPS